MLFLFRIGSRQAFIVISFLIVVFFSTCREDSENQLVLFTALEESLANSNTTITKSTESLFQTFEEKLRDPGLAEKAQVWQSKAMKVKKLTAEMYKYLEKIKWELKKEAGIITDDQPAKFTESDKYYVKQQLITKEKSKELFDKLTQYKKDILSIDSDSKEVFKDFLLVSTPVDSSDVGKQNLNKLFFKNASVITSVTALSQFQNNIRNVENRMIQFCLNKCSYGCILRFEVYSVIVGQSSTYLRGGQEMEITAGVGAFSRSAKPKIMFNEKITPVDDESGVAIYKFKTPKKAGEYKTPVKIIYIDQEGREQSIVKVVEYTVVGETNDK